MAMSSLSAGVSGRGIGGVIAFGDRERMEVTGLFVKGVLICGGVTNSLELVSLEDGLVDSVWSRSALCTGEVAVVDGIAFREAKRPVESRASLYPE